MSQTNIPEIIGTLPVDTRCSPFATHHYCGFWLHGFVLKGIAAAHACFEPRPTNIFLASFPKSGTTWLKALAFTTLNRATHSPDDEHHPLRRRNPVTVGGGGATDHVLQVLPSPRLISTHILYSCCHMALPRRAYVTHGLTVALQQKDGEKPLARTITVSHALEYWEESKTSCESKQVLFLRYEEIMQDPVGNLKKLADLMGCGFSTEEEEARVPQKIVDGCIMETLKGSDVNKKGNTTLLGLKNEAFFRNGVVGDWKNHITPEMGVRLGRVVDQALQGSGLTLSHSM
ncbi:hypothetical protein HU200_052354 [Digitaria exilis]|uniref:Sulfotransferase n=1 Tax=Digitaria exilis TaxID=1010633 RepID=A0A835AP93_9POAL|nr:hypothetical protein HU200_052354 [Digitaria exilis]